MEHTRIHFSRIDAEARKSLRELVQMHASAARATIFGTVVWFIIDCCAGNFLLVHLIVRLVLLEVIVVTILNFKKALQTSSVSRAIIFLTCLVLPNVGLALIGLERAHRGVIDERLKTVGIVLEVLAPVFWWYSFSKLNREAKVILRNVGLTPRYFGASVSQLVRYDWGSCWSCGYDTTGNTTGICPECGAGLATPPPKPTVCPMCHYSLAGLAGDKCPECGKNFV